MTLSDPVTASPAGRQPTALQGTESPDVAPRARPQRRLEPPPAIRALRTGGLRAEIAALIMSGQTGGPLPIEVLTLPVRSGSDKTRLPLTLEVPWQQLLASHEEDPLKLEIFAYALTDSGGLRDSLMQTFEVDAERLSAEQRARGGLKFSGELQLDPGTYSLRVMARNPGNGELGLRIIDLDVPAEGSIVSPMLIAENEPTWQAIRQAYERGQAPAPLPFLDRVPEAKPVLVSRDETAFHLVMSQLTVVPSELVVESVGLEGEVVSEMAAQIEGFEPPSADGVRRLDGRFQTDLAPGYHRLRARLRGDMGEQVTTPVLPVLVVTAEPEPLSWAKVDPGMLRSSPRIGGLTEQRGRDSQRAQSTNPRRRNIDTSTMESGYRNVLDRLASGDSKSASTLLFQLEEGELRRGFDVLEVLRSVELETAHRIAKVDPEALAPILLMHHTQYRRMRARKIPLLSTHARTVTLQLIELFLQRSNSPETRQKAVAVMASLGAEAQQAGMVRLSEAMLRRVLELDDTNEAALLNLGASAERTIDYPTAVDYFKRLVEAYPQHGQGRLRLAINLKRDDKPRQAQRHLEVLVEGQHREWILSLAHQELARIYLRENELQQAIELLRQGIEKVPTDEKLYLQLAFALDADQQYDEMEKVLQTMERRARFNRDTSRRRYTVWPEEALVATREYLETNLRPSGRLETVLASSNFQPTETP